ncbi:MAG: pyridoxamine 5'-phosphate oxidase family protein [Dietzia sp.]
MTATDTAPPTPLVTMPGPTDDPLEAMVAWLAIDPADPPLGVLATVGPDGAPHCRHLLVSGATADGPTFHTDSRSQKAADLAADPRATLVVIAPDRTRQLTVSGVAEPTDRAERLDSYHARNDYLKLLAWANDAATAELAPPGRRRVWSATVDRLGDAPALPPETWLGMRIRPETVTFWAAGRAEPSHRRRFKRDGSRWRAVELPG